MERNPITIFKAEIRGVTIAEYRIRPTIGSVLKHLLLGAGAIGIVWGAKQASEIAHSAIKPQYVINGNSVPNYEGRNK